jgi:hypothetical protein
MFVKPILVFLVDGAWQWILLCKYWCSYTQTITLNDDVLDRCTSTLLTNT